MLQLLQSIQPLSDGNWAQTCDIAQETYPGRAIDVHTHSSSILISTAESTGVYLYCPGNQTISSVEFASFGLPVGACGGLQVNPSCNAETSVSIVEGLCLGNPFCRVPASYEIFTDPCPGYTKTLAVQVNCA